MSKIETPVINTLHTTIEKMMKDLRVPGAAVAIIKDGEVVVSEGFGYRNVEKKEAVTPQTHFAIGSATKAFGTLSLSLLAQQKKFDWDTPVQSYIPNFSLSDIFASSQITGRDLASHRTGVSRHDALWYSSSLTRKDIVEKIKHLSLDAPFRTAFLYNNLMYATISYMVERITNQTWEQYVTEHILEPLHMQQTNFSVTDSQNTNDYALPYIEDNGEIKEIPFRNIDTVGAAGCINSTIEDMANWVLLHLNQGKSGDHELISSELLQQMYTPHNTIPDQPFLSTPESPLNSYGLGWFISAYRGYKVIHHGGNIDGFTALVSFMPKENIGLVILTNSGSTLLPTYLSTQIYDELLGLETIDWHKRAVEDTEKIKKMMKEATESLPEQIKGTAPSHTLEDYTGTFEHPAYGTLQVYKENEKLYVQFMEMDIPLQHHHYDIFSAPVNLFQTKINLLFAYEMNVSGEFPTLQLHVPATLSTQPLTFTKIK
ncbi:penicillin-binding protein [Bacillus pseudomycoides]|uniref:Penicillin-binding protein n=1 Tax=Bacillus pseudomycoides TaxID=64104 RepID=A0AA91ZQY1_9BACI|nr:MULTISPECIES: serine hydrolase [Bacillus]PEB50603.1 penicillin-binding protein [Bacillus sp. AFS098217]PED80095.1 penicillin-binding protein [Bacillus pseudomycoides]PEU08046.1 penicillin-binding protein [Bacillus sp. AFS019443]PEU08986.1 penicillin-binding protein [Bacillus sp. AFS014408]PFW65214.1 penicillin-binding protein [Bacillus sp. AFS075034]